MCSRYKRKFGQNQIAKPIRKIFLEFYKIQFSFSDLSCETWRCAYHFYIYIFQMRKYTILLHYFLRIVPDLQCYKTQSYSSFTPQIKGKCSMRRGQNDASSCEGIPRSAQEHSTPGMQPLHWCGLSTTSQIKTWLFPDAQRPTWCWGAWDEAWHVRVQHDGAMLHRAACAMEALSGGVAHGGDTMNEDEEGHLWFYFKLWLLKRKKKKNHNIHAKMQILVMKECI